MIGDETHLITVRMTPIGNGQMAAHIDSTHPDMRWTSRALRLAADFALIGEDGPAVTMGGVPVEQVSSYGQGAQR